MTWPAICLLLLYIMGSYAAYKVGYYAGLRHESPRKR